MREIGLFAVAAALTAGILLSWCVMCVRVVVEVLFVNRAMVPAVALAACC